MKVFISVLIFLSIPMNAQADYESAIAQLNSELVPIYESLMTEGQQADLVGKRLNLRLNLKHASDRFLLFTDTQVVLDKDTKYYLIKWKFRSNDVKDFLGKTNVICKVKGSIVEVVMGATSPRMPYVVVELISIEL